MAIPKCQYIIRKGESPAPDRSNIFDWTPFFAEKEDKFEAFEGPLPEVVTKSIFNEPVQPVASTRDVKKLLVVEAMKKLEKDDFTANGLPKIFSLQRIVGFDIDAKLRDEAFECYKSMEVGQ